MHIKFGVHKIRSVEQNVCQIKYSQRMTTTTATRSRTMYGETYECVQFGFLSRIADSIATGVFVRLLNWSHLALILSGALNWNVTKTFLKHMKRHLRDNTKRQLTGTNDSWQGRLVFTQYKPETTGTHDTNIIQCLKQDFPLPQKKSIWIGWQTSKFTLWHSVCLTRYAPSCLGTDTDANSH